MTTLSPAQVYTLARGAGFDPATAAIMVAIAGPESGYRTDARGDVGLQTSVWGPSIGLWQIRSLKAQTGTGGTRDASRLTDPTFNAKSAYSIYKGQGLGAWSTYTSGAYRGFLTKANAAAGTGGAPVPLGTASGSTTTTAGSTNAQLVDLPGGNWNPLNWPGAILGKTAQGASGALWAQVQPFLVTSTFVVTGLAMITIGTTVTAWPTVAKASGLPGGTP